MSSTSALVPLQFYCSSSSAELFPLQNFFKLLGIALTTSRWCRFGFLGPKLNAPSSPWCDHMRSGGFYPPIGSPTHIRGWSRGEHV